MSNWRFRQHVAGMTRSFFLDRALQEDMNKRLRWCLRPGTVISAPELSKQHGASAEALEADDAERAIEVCVAPSAGQVSSTGGSTGRRRNLRASVARNDSPTATRAHDTQ